MTEESAALNLSTMQSDSDGDDSRFILKTASLQVNRDGGDEGMNQTSKNGQPLKSTPFVRVTVTPASPSTGRSKAFTYYFTELCAVN